MNSKLFLLGGLSMMVFPFSSEAQNKDPEHPNIIFFLTEDLSPQFMEIYNKGNYGGKTPNVEKLYKEGGLLFNRAYSNASVSSAARTTLITGCYAPRFDGDFHRKYKELPLPENLKMFPTYLRMAGYFTANARKKDYNVQENDGTWDIGTGQLGDWEKRKDKSQPFFFQRSNVVTHESQIQFTEQVYHTVKTKTDPSKTRILPFLPKTDLMRYTFAKEYDNIAKCDEEFGKMVNMLKKDGELDNTFIFFFGDNGGTLPGTKGYTDDIGYHVPMMVYIPKTWRKKLGYKLNSEVEGKVTFMDLGPTALHLAGVKIPGQMDGKPFIGTDVKLGSDVAHCYGDRYDEYYSFNRCLYKGDYRYARNYTPIHSQSLFANYRYKQLAFMEWRDLYDAGKLNDRQSRFFQPIAPEELYNIKTDPNEMHNLANDPKYKKILLEMRKEEQNYLLSHADLGFYPETVIYEEAFSNPDAWGNKHKKNITRYMQIADMQMQPLEKNYDDLKAVLEGKKYDPVQTWWVLNTIAYFGKKAERLKPFVVMNLNVGRSYVQSAALVAMANMGIKISPSDIYPVLKNCRTEQETVLCLNDIVYLVENKFVEPFKINNSMLSTLGETEQGKYYINVRTDYLNQIYFGCVRHFNK